MAFSEEAVQALVNSYPELCGTDPTSYVIQDFDGVKVKHRLVEVCHADLKYHELGVFDELITACPRQEDHEIAYIRALINGPFQKWKDVIELVQTASGYYYLHIKDLSQVPARVVFNFCIASRAPIEFKGILDRFKDLIGGGIHPSVALAVSGRSLLHNRMENLLTPSSGHWWYQSNHDWAALVGGNPQNLDNCPSFKDNPTASAPADIIWGKGDPITLKSYLTVTIDKLDEKFRKELNLQ